MGHPFPVPVGRIHRIRLLLSLLLGHLLLQRCHSWIITPLSASSRPHRTTTTTTTSLSASAAPQERTYLATCIPGVAPLLAEELQELGASRVEVTSPAAVTFQGTPRTALTTLLWARTPHKIMERLCQGNVQDRLSLYQFCQDHIDVKELLGDGQGGLLTLSVQITLNNPTRIPTDINHSHYSALTIKNALVDQVRNMRGDRPDVELEQPDVPLVAVLRGQGPEQPCQISIFRQLHVGSLHRRGYRQGGAVHKAALKESLASALLRHAGWPSGNSENNNSENNSNKHQQQKVLIDPMAGSGTLLLEAACMAADLAPGLLRIKCGLPYQQYPPMIRWKYNNNNNDEEDMVQVWKEMCWQATERAKAGIQRCRQEGLTLIGNELHEGAMDLFQDAVEAAGLTSLIRIQQGDCRDFVPQTHSEGPWTVVCNPPWGVRLDEDMAESWEALRVFLRETCPPGTRAWVLSGNPTATKHLGLRRSSSLAIQTGDQDLRWLEYGILDKSEVINFDKKQNETRNDTFRNESSRKEIKKEAPAKPRRRVEPRVTVPDEENEWLLD